MSNVDIIWSQHPNHENMKRNMEVGMVRKKTLWDWMGIIGINIK